MKDGKTTVVHLITKLELGGAQINTLYTAENLDPLRYDVYLLSGAGGMLKSRLADQDRLVMVPALAREIHFFRDMQVFFSLLRFFRHLRPEIVHTHSSKAGILGRLAAHWAGVPIIVHSVHGFSFSPYQSFFKRNFFLLAEKICSRLTSHFVFVAQSDILLARKKSLVGDNFSLIRSGFALEKFMRRLDDASALKKKYGLENAHFVCGVVAPFKPQKGLGHLIEIADRVIKKNPRVIFFIAGDGELRPDLEQELQRRGILQNFRLPGFVRDVENAMDCFDLGLSTALWEGLPQSLVQMRLKKKAVIASDIPGNREVIRDGESGYLIPVSEHERFAAAILELAGDEALRARLANFTGDDFGDWSDAVMVTKQEELYQCLLAKSWMES